MLNYSKQLQTFFVLFIFSHVLFLFQSQIAQAVVRQFPLVDFIMPQLEMQSSQIAWQGEQLEFSIFTPPLLTPQPRPIVILLHSEDETSETLAENSAMNELALRENFFAIYPKLSSLRQTSQQNSDQSRPRLSPTELTVRQAAMIKHFVELLIKSKHVDAKKVFVIGHDSASALAAYLSSCYPGIFRAGALYVYKNITSIPQCSEQTKTNGTKSPLLIIEGQTASHHWLKELTRLSDLQDDGELNKSKPLTKIAKKHTPPAREADRTPVLQWIKEIYSVESGREIEILRLKKRDGMWRNHFSKNSHRTRLLLDGEGPIPNASDLAWEFFINTN